MAKPKAKNQIRGSFMIGGGPGEDAVTEVDQETHAQFKPTAPQSEKDRAIAAAKQKSQEQYESDVDDPQIVMAVAGPGAVVHS